MAELDAGDLLAVVDSDQVIGDWEQFRQAIGSPKVWLYGESYGTQVAQAHATQVPEAVRGVILDGVVDLNLSEEGFYAAYTLASEKLLACTLDSCSTLPGCAKDVGQGAAQANDALAAKGRNGPPDVDLVLADGCVAKRTLTTGLLETSALYALYSPEGRTDFLRALAAAERGNLVPMLRMGYSSMYIDPETETGPDDPGWYGGAYYAIMCSDYDSGNGDPAERAARIIDQARKFALQASRPLRSYDVESLACAFWPYQGQPKRPEPFVGGDYPTSVLNGEADPITPISMAYSVLDHVANSYPISVGCDVAGTITINASFEGKDYALNGCSFWPNLSVSGTVSEIMSENAASSFSLSLSVSGAHRGEIGYIYNGEDEAWSLIGTYDGQAAGLTRTFP